MGIPLLIIGLLMVITGGRGTYAQFGSQVASEFQSQGTFGTPDYHPGFGMWILALGLLGAVGYIQSLQKISRLLMALVILVIFLANKGFFAKFTTALQQGPTPPNAVPENTGFSIPITLSWATSGQSGNPPTAQAAQATGAGTVNSLLQSIPGIGSWFAPPPAGSPAPAF